MGTDASQVLVSDISFNRKNQGSLRDWNHREKYLNNEIYKSTAIELEHLVISKWNQVPFQWRQQNPGVWGGPGNRRKMASELENHNAELLLF